MHGIEELDSFRLSVFNVVKAIGGTEVIYLADNACDKLSSYLELRAFENVPYEDIKRDMIAVFGPAKRDYSLLNEDLLNYESINEFFIDDFEDLRAEG